VANAVVALVVYIGVSMLLQVLVKAIFGDSYNAEETQELGYAALTGVELAIAGICLVVLAPFTEEIIFRGFMYRGLRRQLPFWLAAFVVSAIFGLVHGQWNVGLDVFAMSLISCYLVEKTGSLWPSIFLHSLKNAVAFCIVYLYNGA
jgi:membrane protease YdiL (CAAX protease family)